MKLNETISRK